MKKIILLALFAVVSISAFSQEVLNLGAYNMTQYIGKVNKEQFEKVVGTSVGMEGEHYIYNVIAKLDKMPTAIRCFYRESDGKLIAVRFGTVKWLSYALSSIDHDWAIVGNVFKGATEQTHVKYKENSFGDILKRDFVYGNFGQQIYDIEKQATYTTAIVNYHTVK